MKRFASLATTAALAGSLIAAGSAAHATFTYNLVPVSNINATYNPGDTILVALTVTTTNTAITTLSANSSIGVDPTVADFNNIGDTVDPVKFPGTNSNFWNLPGPSSYTSGTAGSLVLSVYQATPAHTALKNPAGGTFTIPVGTYTAVTFSVPILASATASSATIYLPSALTGFGNTATNQDYVASKAGAVNATDQGTPAFGTSQLTYNIKQSGSATPAPSSLLVVALGALPAAGALRRRRLAAK